MNLKIPFVLLALHEASIIALSQNQVIPDGFWEIAKDFPVLAIFLGTLFFLMKWGERILESQRVALKEIYEGNQEFVSALLGQIESRQDKMDSGIEMLAVEIRSLHATLGELTKVDDVIEQMIDRIGRRTDK